MEASTLDRPVTAAPAADAPLILVDECVQSRLRYTREDIVAFARLCGDQNVLHHSRTAAQRASYGEIIASGQQTASHMMGVAASFFSRNDDGREREMLTLNFNFAFRRPIFAEQDVVIAWRVREVSPSRTLSGLIGQLDGTASVGGVPCVIGRGTLLVRPLAQAQQA